jgi:hypothetical protein
MSFTHHLLTQRVRSNSFVVAGKNGKFIASHVLFNGAN